MIWVEPVLSLRSFASSYRFVKVSGSTQLKFLATYADFCNPNTIALVPRHTDDPRHVAGWHWLIARVIYRGRGAQIFNAVVSLDAVYVINLLGRPLSVVQRPRDPMSFIPLTR